MHVNSSTEQSSDACAFLWVSFLMSCLSVLYLQFYTSYTSVSLLVTSLGMIQPGIVAKGTVLRGVLCAVLLNTFVDEWAL